MPTQPKRIAIIRLGSMGDIIHALPVANRLKREWPQTKISWLVEPAHKELLSNHPDIDEIIILDTKAWRKKNGLEAAREIRLHWRELQRRKFDLALELQGLIKSGIIAYATGAPERLGFAWAECREPVSSLFTNRHVYPGKGIHIIQRNLAFVSKLGLATEPWDYNLKPEPAASDYIRQFLKAQNLQPDRLVGINPGAAWPTKRWGAKKFALLTDMLAQRLGAQILLIWGPGELELAQEIQRLAGSPTVLACPTDIKQLMALLAQCKLLIVGDTGPLHLGAAMGTHCVGIFGPTDPVRNGPYGGQHVTVQHKLPCSNCYRRRCEHAKCIMEIEPEEVFEAASRLL